MKGFLVALFLGCFLMLSTMQPAKAIDGYVITRNETPDAWVWITLYCTQCLPGRSIKASYCVGPGATDHRDWNHGDMRIRAEVTRKNCSHPGYLDREVRARPMHGETVTVYVRGAHGKYTFSK